MFVPNTDRQIISIGSEAVNLELKPGETKTIYAKTQYLIKPEIIYPISITDFKHYTEEIAISNLFQGIFQGLLWMMFFYGLFLFISTREKSYIYYIVYVFSFAALMLHAFQYLRNYIFPSNPSLSSFFGIFLYAAFVFYYLLMREFIDSKHKFPRLDKSLKTIIVVNAVITVIVFISQIIFNADNFGILGMEFVFLNAIILFVFIVIILKVGNVISKIFVTGTLVLVLFQSIAIIATYLGSNSKYLILLFEAGIVGEIFIFSAGLSYKYRITQKQKQKVQEDLISQLKENHELQTKVNRELEQKVKERTEEIEEKNEILKHTNNDLNLVNEELNTTLENLKQTQSQLVQAEKMAGLGQLTAGIAHKINNPINYVTSGSNALHQNLEDIKSVLKLYAEVNETNIKEKLIEIDKIKTDIEFDEVTAETDSLIESIKTGGEKVATIVRSFRTFSRLDENMLKSVDIHENIDATLAMLT